MRHQSAAPASGQQRWAPREDGDHLIYLEDGLTLEAFFEFVDTLPIQRGKP
jgi:hypothetical protein